MKASNRGDFIIIFMKHYILVISEDMNVLSGSNEKSLFIFIIFMSELFEN